MHKKYLKEIGQNLDYLKKHGFIKDYESIERQLEIILKGTRGIRDIHSHSKMLIGKKELHY